MNGETEKSSPTYLTWSLADGVAVARFRYIRMLRFEEFALIEAELAGLASARDVRTVVLNMDQVEQFTSRLLGILASLSKVLGADGRKLLLCRLRPEPLRAFRLCRLDKLIGLYATEEEARTAATAAK